MDLSIRSIFLEKFTSITGSFYERKCMMEAGDFLGAVNSKPSGVWYSNDYAKALRALGDTPLVINAKGVEVKASLLAESFKAKDFFYTFMGSSQFWQVPSCEDTFIKKKVNVLQLKDGVPPADAYEKLASGLSFLDCNTVLDLALALALIEKFGKARFNRVCANLNHRFIGDITDLLHNRFYSNEPAVLPTLPDLLFSSPMRPGDFYFVSNHELYEDKHPHGVTKGMNLVCVGNTEERQPLFTGLGLPPHGVVLKEVAKMLLQEFNDDPIDPSLILSEEKIKTFHEQESRLKFSIEDKEITLTFSEIKELSSSSSFVKGSLIDQLHEAVLLKEEKTRELPSKKITETELLSEEANAFLKFSSLRIGIDEEKIEALFRA
jgi:hypothetical protein